MQVGLDLQPASAAEPGTVDLQVIHDTLPRSRQASGNPGFSRHRAAAQEVSSDISDYLPVSKAPYANEHARNDTMSKDNESMTLEFRCPAELEGKLQPPIAASLGLTNWLT